MSAYGGPYFGNCEGEKSERGERGKRGKRGEKGERGERGRRGRGGRNGDDGPTGPTGSGFTGPTGFGATGPTGSTGPAGLSGFTGPTGDPGPGIGLLKFSGTIPSTGFALEAVNIADGGFGSLPFPDNPLTGPFPGYPITKPVTISSLCVDVYAAGNVFGSVSVQLVRVPFNAPGPDVLIGAPVTFPGLLTGTNVTDCADFGPVVLDRGDRLALRVFSTDGAILSANLNVSATAG